MKLRLIGLTLAAAVFGAACAKCQDEGEDPELQRVIQVLKSLIQAEPNLADTDAHVSQIGRSVETVTREQARVVRLYDMSDLFVVAPPYRARRGGALTDLGEPFFAVPAGQGMQTGGFGGGMGGGMGGGGFGGAPGGMMSVEETRVPPRQKTLHTFGSLGSGGDLETETVRISMDQLIETITTTIEPDSWDEVGGPGSISQLGTSLVIATTEHTHQQIVALLKQFRERWGTLRTVTLQADWIWLRAEEVAHLLSGDQRLSVNEVDLEAWKRLRASVNDDPPRLLGTGMITCQNGQTVHLLSGGRSLRVNKVIPVVGGPEAAAYQPGATSLQEGPVLQVTPLANRTSNFVTLDIHSRVVLSEDAEPKAEISGDAHEARQVASIIDGRRVTAQNFSTTLRIPADRTCLVGGMTFDRDATENLYLFVSAQIQELRDPEEIIEP